MAYLPALPPVVFHVVFLVGPFSVSVTVEN